MVAWDRVTRREVLRAIDEYDRLGPQQFFSEHGFALTTTYELVWNKRRYPPKAVLGAAYEFATGQRLASGDFEGGKTGAVRVLGKLGFTVQDDNQPAESDIHGKPEPWPAWIDVPAAAAPRRPAWRCRPMHLDLVRHRTSGRDLAFFGSNFHNSIFHGMLYAVWHSLRLRRCHA